MSTEKMRIRKGRVVHTVVRRFGRIESVCRKPHPVKGVHSTMPRAEAPPDWWTLDRAWYPDCAHCLRADQLPYSS